MDINRANIDAMFTGFNQAFRRAFGNAGVPYETMAMQVTAGTKLTEFPFLKQFSGMREWLGPRQKKNIASQKLQVMARKFEDTVGVPVDDIEDDQYGVYTPIIEQMGQSAANLWGELAFAALVGNGNWLDGNSFFNDSRTYGDGEESSAIDNLSNSALSYTTYKAAREAMMSYCGHGGRPLNVVPNLLVVGPANEATAKEIVKARTRMAALEGDTEDDTIIDHEAAPNPMFETAEVMVSTQLVGTYSDYWFLMDTRGALKPIIVAKREVPTGIIRKDRLDDDNVFWEDEVVYGTKARGEAALALPHLCYGGIV